MPDSAPSIDLFDETRQLLLALERRGVEYALVGAVALAVHGVPRATADIDLLLVDANLEEVWASRRRFEASFAGAWVVSREALIRMKTWAGREQDLADVKRLVDLDR